jgi:hypothetical protein
VAEDGMLCLSQTQLHNKVALTQELLQEKINLMRGATTMAYPMGLPKWDPIFEALADEHHTSEIYGPDRLDADEAQLWWAGMNGYFLILYSAHII